MFIKERNYRGVAAVLNVTCGSSCFASSSFSGTDPPDNRCQIAKSCPTTSICCHISTTANVALVCAQIPVKRIGGKIAKLLNLMEWANEKYSKPPSLSTLRRWVREGRIYPCPELHGREYMLEPDSVYVDPRKSKMVRKMGRPIHGNTHSQGSQAFHFENKILSTGNTSGRIWPAPNSVINNVRYCIIP